MLRVAHEHTGRHRLRRDPIGAEIEEDGMKRFNNATAPSLDRRDSTSTAILAPLSGVTITVIGLR